MKKLSEQIRIFVHTISRTGEYRFEEAGHPVNIKQQFLLEMMSQHEEVFQTVLAELLNKDKSAVLREIDALEEKGLVLRQNDPVDRRKKRLLLTDAGRQVHLAGQEIIHAMMGDLTQGIPAEDLAVFSRVMAQIAQNGMNPLK